MKIRRVWTNVAVAEEGGRFAILLDGKGMRTPAKRPLAVPTRPLADAIAREWGGEGDLSIDRMPMTRSANAAIDKVATQKAAVAAALSAYGETDLLCYRAEEPRELVLRQRAAWDPLLDWAAAALGARLIAVSGVMPARQEAQALAALRERVERIAPFPLTAFHDLVMLSGSLILAFAVTEGRLSAKEAWQLSRLDETWQSEHWGEDAEAAAAEAVKREAFLHAKRFWRLSDASRSPS